MEVNEVITKFQEFVEKNCQTELFENIRLGKHVLIIDFQELCKFNLDVSEELLDKPEETLKAFELAIKNFDLSENANDIKLITVRVKNLPKEQYILIRNIRSSHLGKFIWTEGVVRQKSDVRPQVTSARFECPSCGNIIPVLQLEKKFKEPSRCNCGRNGKFKMISKELVDAQGIVLEESTKDMEGGEQPKRINIFLKNDLVSPMSEKRTNPGNNIRVVGIIKEVPIILKTGGQSTKFDLLIEANCVEGVEEDYSNIEISKEDEERIKVLASDPLIYEKLTSSLAPGIFGHDRVKEALCLQFVGGITKHREDGVKTRGDIHILLIGDPGCGKCVSGETKIITENGEIISVESFYNNQIKNQMELENNATYVNQIMLNNNTAHKNRKIFSINEKGLSETYVPASVCRRKAPQRIIKIVTNTGNEIKVTKEHPLFTTNNGLIFAKEAMEYTIGEYIALPSRIKVNGELQSIADAKNKILKTNANNKVKYNIKEIFDADFARLIGYLLGDGYVKFRKTTGIISFTNNDKDLLDDFEKLMQAVFNVNVSKRKRIGSYEYYASSIELVRILHIIIPSITELSGEKGTSRIITTSPNYVLKEFIKSLFDCEAHVRKDGRVIEFSSKSREMSYNLKYLLLRFGIISQLNSEMKCATNTKLKIKRKYYRLRISGEDVVKYHNYIGFTSKQKQKRLINCVNSSKKLNTNIKIVPNIKELLTTLRKKYGLSQFSFPVIRSTYQHYEKGDRFPSYDKLKKLAVFYKNINKEDSLIEILNQISNADIFWDKIKSVQELECKEEYVYDLEIDQVHNFVANGVVVHNSQLLKRASVVAPKARYVSGKGVSGAGLTAAVVKDEFLSGWSLEAGAMVLANKGILMVDELDKMSPEDRDAMHEGLEQQSVSISKANIQATLRCETTVLAAANPKLGRFDPYGTIAGQIDLPPTLISRFDLIFPIKDLPDEEKDTQMATFILELHKMRNTEEPDIPTELLRKYLVYAKQKMSPQLTDGAIEELKDYYVQMRSSGAGEEKGIKTIPITARQLEGLVRLSEAYAKLRFGDKVTRKDAKKAKAMLEYCLQQVGMDPETGKIDIDRISTGVSTTERSRIVIVREIINELEETLGKNIPLQTVIDAAKEKGIDEDKTMELIEKMKRNGDLFEPKRGEIQKI